MSKETRKPLVSVCIPAYAGTAFIGPSIESVLAQTFDNFELVIIDDNSMDGVMAIVNSFNDPRIRFLHNDRNLGPEGNWNRCLAEARGRYFKLLPQDDLLAPDCLERQVAVFEADVDESIALVFCSRTIVDSVGCPLMTRSYPSRRKERIRGQSAMLACLRSGTNLIGEPGGVLFRKKMADYVGGFDGSIGYVIDLDYWFRLLLRGDAYYLPEKLVSFRISSRSWSVAIGNRQCVDFRRFIAKVAAKSEIRPGVIDIVAGNVMALVNNLLRMCVYTFLQRKGHLS